MSDAEDVMAKVEAYEARQKAKERRERIATALLGHMIGQWQDEDPTPCEGTEFTVADFWRKDVASAAIAYADALIAELDK